MGLQGLFLVFVVVSQCINSSFQAPNINNQEKSTILDIFQKDFKTRNCSNALVDPEKAVFLNECNVHVPEKNFKPENFKSYLCMAYYDVNLKICDRMDIEEIKLHKSLPQNKTDIEDILKSLNTNTIADDFCDSPPADIGKSNFKETKDYVKIFFDAISDRHICVSTCHEFYGTLNSLCKIILWANSKVSDHDDAAMNLEKMNHLVKSVTTQLKAETEALPTPVAAAPGPKTSPTVMAPVVHAEVFAPLIPPKVSAPPIPPKVPGPSVQYDTRNNSEITESKHMSISSDSISIPKPAHSNPKPIIGSGLPQKPKVDPVPETVVNTPNVQKASSKVPEYPVFPKSPISGSPKLPESSKNNYLGDINNPDYGKDLEGDPSMLEDDDNNESTLLKHGHKQIDLEFEEEPDREVAVGRAGGTSPVETPRIVEDAPSFTSSGHFIGAEDSHFFLYFLFVSGVLIFGYIVFHNKNKVLGLLLEGRKGEGRRRCPGGGPAYRKLDCTLEEAVNSAPPSHTPHIVY